MCGIFGYFNQSGKTLPHSQLEKMGHIITHRGPDDQGIHAGKHFALGNQRLSIIDVEHGHQPFVSDDGSIIVVQNGEIFNHVELAAELALKGVRFDTHSDTEVILRLYESEGIDFIHKLNGMFAISIYDARLEAMFIIRDRIGVKPLYIAQNQDGLLFASEIKSLLAAGFQAKPNLEAIDAFLAYNYIPQPLTAFEGITQLEPAHYLKITQQQITKHQWWNLAEFQQEERSESAWIEEFNDILEDATKIRLRCDVPYGAFLSGGVDSSTIVGLMAKQRSEPIKTFCIGFDDPRYDESEFAQAAATRFGTDHVMEKVSPNLLHLWPKMIYHCDQPHGDVSFMPTYRVSELAARDVKVVLTGDGGDELFAGYDKHKNFFAQDHGAQFHADYFNSISLMNPGARQNLYQKGHGLNFDKPAALAQQHFDQTAHMDPVNQALYLDMQLLLSGNNLVKPDRMGMAVSLEARTPFLDYRMMELAFKIPGHLKLKDGETKYIYKKAVAPLIGDELAYRKKQMFTVPIGDWLRTDLASETKNFILSEGAQSRGLFDTSQVDKMLNAHTAGTANFTREIRALVSLELWHQIFIDKQDHSTINLYKR